MNPTTKKTMLEPAEVAEALQRIGREIIQADTGGSDLVLIGIRTGGAHLAKRLQTVLADLTGLEVPTGVIDINLYRDDWTRAAQKPVVGKTEVAFSIDDKRVVLVDDVLFTGRTIRAALDALMDLGRPSKIELAVLCDRGHRELPICPDYRGLTIETDLRERVNVYLSELGNADEVAIEGCEKTHS